MSGRSQVSPLREKMADQCHAQWVGWMKYLFTRGVFHKDGSFTINAKSVDRWLTQNACYYHELSEKEKDSDRKEADKFLKIVKDHEQTTDPPF